MGYWNEAANFDFAASWILAYLTGGLFFLDLEVSPGSSSDVHPSAIEIFQPVYSVATTAYLGLPVPPELRIRDRQGTALAIFYLGWASHLLQDMTVAQHTFEAFMPWTGHTDYENAADNRGQLYAPIADGRKRGIYDGEFPIVNCTGPSRTCFLTFAAEFSHNSRRFDRIKDGDYTSLGIAIPFAQNLQAGLYAAFLTDVGLQPVHMSAVVPAIFP